MNKILWILVLVILVLPIIGFAQNDYCTLAANLNYIDPYCTQNQRVPVANYGTCCLFNSVYVVTNWVRGIIAALTGLFIIVGAFYIITAGGNPDRVTEGRKYIMYAVIGMVVFIFASAIPAIARSIMGM